MAIKLLANTVYHASQVVATTQDSGGSYADTTETKQRNVVGGPRNIKFTPDDANTEMITYVETNGGLACDALVITHSDGYTGQKIRCVKFTAYKGTDGSTLTDNVFTETGIGPYQQDYVWTFTRETNMQGFGFEVSAASVFGKIYLCDSFSFEHQSPSGPLARFRPAWITIEHGGRAWNVEQQGTFFFTGLTAANIDSYHALFKTHEQYEPVFLYDSDGTVIADKLWHCLITQAEITQVFEDNYQMSLETYLLRHYT